MSDIPAAQRKALINWSRQAIDAGWLPENAPTVLNEATVAAPHELFGHTNRPLVAGLFGGTGAGKSTLLNRLADEPVARASAERPTSRDVTVYVHRSVSVEQLPEHLPMQRIRTALHNNEGYRHVMFVDMPDFDSVEVQNRELVELWLPHIDVVIYVVNPERYRDDQGWRLLQRHAHEHAWLFIMNHWDKGSDIQLEDFTSQLKNAGLADPLVFRTDCSSAVAGSTDNSASADTVKDDFPALQDTLTELANQSIVAALHQHGLVSRLQAMRSLSDQWLSSVDRDDTLTSLPDAWSDYWHEHRESVEESMHWSFAQLAARYAQTDPFVQRLLRKRASMAGEITIGTDLSSTVNDRMDNHIDNFINQTAQQHTLPVAALKQAVSNTCAPSRQNTQQTLQDAVNRSLVSPGNPWQRRLYRLLSTLCVILPVAAAGWIGWRIVTAFIEGGSNPAAYLGSSFAINSALLLGVAWLLPALLHTKITPSREQALLQGLNQGLASVLDHCGQYVDDALQNLSRSASALTQDYQELWTSLPELEGQVIPDQIKRLIVAEITQPDKRDLDVRANTHSSTLDAPVS